MKNNLPLVLAAVAGAYFLTKKPAKKTTTPPVDKDKQKEKVYLSIFPNRKILIDQYLHTPPAKFEFPFNIIPLYNMTEYVTWSDNATKGTYQEWLTTMIYIQIAITEHLWDADSGELPIFLECGKKLTLIKLDTTEYNFQEFEETQEQCFNRLHLGRTLWKDINDYVKDNLTTCPPGAKCE